MGKEKEQNTPSLEEQVNKEQEQATEQTTEQKFNVVVCAYNGSEELVKEIWTKRFNESIKLLSVEETFKPSDVLAEIIADNSVADEFTVVWPNTVPCSDITLPELRFPVVYVTAIGEKRYNEKLPCSTSKEIVVEILSQNLSDEEALLKALTEKGPRPFEVGYTFGNYVTPVRRANPCENIVIEALVRKKFIIASPEGFNAIKELLVKYLG